jgi:hypothetical protein
VLREFKKWECSCKRRYLGRGYLTIGRRTILNPKGDDFFEKVDYGRACICAGNESPPDGGVMRMRETSGIYLNESKTDRKLNQLGQVLHIELVHNIGPMSLDGAYTNTQDIGNLPC